MKIATWLAFVLALASCKPSIKEGLFGCEEDSDCPSSMICRSDNLCWATEAGDAGPRDTGPRRDSGPRRDALPRDAIADRDIGEPPEDDAAEDAEVDLDAEEDAGRPKPDAEEDAGMIITDTGIRDAGCDPAMCDDSNPCTDNACDPAGGGCLSPTFNSARCDDGFTCNGQDTCADGLCRLHDGDPCVPGMSFCVEPTGCTACGGPSQPCCPSGQACISGTVCDMMTVCVACGGLGESCCAQSMCTATGTFCEPNTQTCVTCGLANEPCCPNDECNAPGTPGLICMAAVCRPCGGDQEVCCIDRMPLCQLGHMCNANICLP